MENNKKPDRQIVILMGESGAGKTTYLQDHAKEFEGHNIVSRDMVAHEICILKEKEHCVCKLMELVGSSQSLISHHLKDLKNAGIVENHKKGLYVYYSLTKKGKHIINLLLKI